MTELAREEIFLKLRGVGMATSIFLDATVVRMLLVPALMQLFGGAKLVDAALARPQAAALRCRGVGGGGGGEGMRTFDDTKE